MRLRDESRDYLTGQKLDRKYTLCLDCDASDFVLDDRIEILRALAAGKKVIHAGCVDHDPRIVERKRAAGVWLHEILLRSAKRCYGVDTSAKGIAYLRDVLGHGDVEQLDIRAGPSPSLAAEAWDLLLLPEILEHQNDPVSFLRDVRRTFAGNVRELVVTVPNGFHERNFRMARRGREHVNSDHRYWFTPYTLARVLTEAGFVVQELKACMRSRPQREKAGLLQRSRLKRHPLLRSNLVGIADFGRRIGPVDGG